MLNGKSIEKSIKEYSRGIIGGLLFSFPLLYTMEVWWTGYTVKSYHLILLIFVTYILLLGYNRYAGMHPSVKWKSVLLESVEEMGLGLLISFIVLLLLNRIYLADNMHEIIGKVIIEAMAVSIGVSIGTAQLGSSANGESEKGSKNNKEAEDDEKEQKENGPDRRTGKIALVILAFCGSVLVASSIAPTDEVVLIAIQSEPYHILAIALISIFLSLVVGYFSNFKGTEKIELKPDAYDITLVACVSYLVALISSAFILWFFGRFQNLSLWYIVSECVVLGAIASLGGSAGRFLIK